MEKLLRATDWLKDILACTLAGTWTNACPLEEIQTDAMSEPSPEKLRYYEQYFEKTHELPHAIAVDENRQLRDGYVLYLLAKKYGVSAEVCETLSLDLFCSRHKTIRKHRKAHMEEGEGTGHEK